MIMNKKMENCDNKKNIISIEFRVNLNLNLFWIISSNAIIKVYNGKFTVGKINPIKTIIKTLFFEIILNY